MNISLRQATKNDLPKILELIHELAAFEKAPGEVVVTKEQLEEDGFGKNPLFEVILAEDNSLGILGMSFYFTAYSTWKGKCLYLEDIIVKENFRKKGIGKKLFEATIQKAGEMGAKRMMWQVLDWNKSAIDFYQYRYGAEINKEWLNGRLTESQIKTFNAGNGS